MNEERPRSWERGYDGVVASGFREFAGAHPRCFIQAAGCWLLMISDRPFHPVRHAAVFTFWALLIFVISAAAGSWVTRNTVLVEAITALGPVVFWAVYRHRWRRPEVMPVTVGIPSFLLWLCPVLVVLTNVFGLRLAQWPDLATISSVAGYCLLIGMAEEMTFRGVMHAAFRALAPAWYVLISSAVFGVLHYSQGIEGIGVTSLVGLAFALARVAGMPLVALILCHALIDMPGALGATKTQAFPVLVVIALVYAPLIALAFLLQRRHWTRPVITPGPSDEANADGRRN